MRVECAGAVTGLNRGRGAEFIDVVCAGGGTVEAGLDAVTGRLDLGEGEVCKEVWLGAMENGRKKERRTDFRDDAGHIEALGVADAAIVLGVEARADFLQAVAGREGASQSAGCQGENEESC